MLNFVEFKIFSGCFLTSEAFLEIFQIFLHPKIIWKFLWIGFKILWSRNFSGSFPKFKLLWTFPCLNSLTPLLCITTVSSKRHNPHFTCWTVFPNLKFASVAEYAEIYSVWKIIMFSKQHPHEPDVTFKLCLLCPTYLKVIPTKKPNSKTISRKRHLKVLKHLIQFIRWK